MVKKKGFVIQWKHAGGTRWKPIFRGKGNPRDPYKRRGDAERGARDIEAERTFIMARVRKLEEVVG